MQWPRLPSWGAPLAVLVTLLLSPRAACALTPPERVSVLTMGPGDHPFTRFGHNAILLEWSDGTDAVYNYGTFEFDGARGARDFLAGRFRYWLSVGTLEGTLRAYGSAARSLTAQELSLTLAERARLQSALTDNARPERRYYAYDYYRDNCSTRVRDAVDDVLGGALRRQVSGDGRLTYRQHTLRLVGRDALLFFGLDAALGRPTDRPISRWEELFLPGELHRELLTAKRPGSGEPLVRAERQFLPESRVPPPDAPPSRTGAYAVVGLALGLSLGGLGLAGARSSRARALFGAVTALLGTLLGLLGCALALFQMSQHWAAHQNPTLLACPPWALVLSWSGLQVGRGRRSRLLRVALGASLVTSSALLLLASWPPHDSPRQVALFVPLWAGWLYGADRAIRELAPRAA